MLIAVTARIGSAQSVRVEALDTIKAAPYDAFTYVPPTDHAAKRAAAPAATFQINFSSNFPTEARAAFRHAADIWATHLESSIPIVIDAEWASLAEQTLGAAGPTFVYADFSPTVPGGTYYPSALANAIARRDLNAREADIRATFNSNFDNWHFDPNTRPPAGHYDFVSVVAHEIGHGLGFTGSFKVDSGDPEEGADCPNVGAGHGCWGVGDTGLPYIFDRFTEDAHDVQLTNTSVYPNPSLELGQVLQSNAVYFDGPAVRQVFADVPVDLYAPESFEFGSSYAHLRESTFPAGSPNSLMTPFLAGSEVIHSPGALTCAIFQDIGWQLGENCLALFPTDTAIEEYEPVLAGDDVVLTWIIAPSPALTSVEVQRRSVSLNSDFTTIASLPAGQVTGSRYEYRVEDLFPGSYEFRLKLSYGASSQAGYSAAREVEIPITASYALRAFGPNPAAFTVNALLVVERAQNVYIEVYDIAGRRVRTVFHRAISAGTQQPISIDVSALSSGTYFVRIVGEDFATSRSIVVAK